MKRGSLYASEQAFVQFDAAIKKVQATLGGDTPRHMAVSALLSVGAEHADEAIRKVESQRLAELTERLAALKANAKETEE